MHNCGAKHGVGAWDCAAQRHLGQCPVFKGRRDVWVERAQVCDGWPAQRVMQPSLSIKKV